MFECANMQSKLLRRSESERIQFDWSRPELCLHLNVSVIFALIAVHRQPNLLLRRRLRWSGCHLGIQRSAFGHPANDQGKHATTYHQCPAWTIEAGSWSYPGKCKLFYFLCLFKLARFFVCVKYWISSQWRMKVRVERVENVWLMVSVGSGGLEV